VAIGDLSGDGKPDLAVANNSSPGTVSVLLGNGDGTFVTNSNYVTGAQPSCVAMRDVNGDGRPDLAVTNGSPQTVSVLPGNGDGTFGAKSDYGTGRYPSSVAIEDLNGDGKPDLAVANLFSNTVSVLLNIGDGEGAPTAVAFYCAPNTLNLTSHGLWVTGFLEPASPFTASDIDVSSIRVNGTVPVDPAAPTALGDHDGNGIPDLMVKFNRVALELTLSEGDDVAINVTGKLGSKSFQGSDHIRVRHVPVSAPGAGAHLTAGSVTQVRWQTPSGIRAEFAALLHSFDGGATWSLVARGLPNTGSCDWTVPNLQTQQAKVAVVLAESADESGNLMNGALGVSGAFSIAGLVGVGDGESAVFALRGVTPNPSQHELRVSFSLRDAKPATLALFDISGRQLEAHRVGGMGPGWHTVALGGRGSLPAGLYIIRLTQEGQNLTTRAAVVR
jgi:hypothetical protein